MRRIVTLGGGTGTFVVLSGLRRLPDVSLTAIVTVADDGGSTGRLRDAYGFLPPGDVRQALVALAEEGNVLRDLFAYRFTKGDIAGHSLGNLFLTALMDLSQSSTVALAEAAKILRLEGSVIPATEAPAVLDAYLADGTRTTGQQAISTHAAAHGGVRTLTLAQAQPLTSAAHDALARADLIVLGPGCLYSSTIAALLADGTREAIASASARLVYVANLFTKAGETDGLTLGAHVAEVARYAGREPDAILVHEGDFPEEVLAWYARENEHPLVDDLRADARVRRQPLASVDVVPPMTGDPLRRSLMRHDSSALADVLSAYLP